MGMMIELRTTLSLWKFKTAILFDAYMHDSRIEKCNLQNAATDLWISEVAIDISKFTTTKVLVLLNAL